MRAVTFSQDAHWFSSEIPLPPLNLTRLCPVIYCDEEALIVLKSVSNTSRFFPFLWSHFGDVIVSRHAVKSLDFDLLKELFVFWVSGLY